MTPHKDKDRTEANLPARLCHPTHESLLKRLLDVEQFVVAADRWCVEELRESLAGIRTDVIAHFRSEEQDGPLSDLMRKEPRFAHAARRILEEHRDLEESLDTLLEVAAVAESIDDALRSKIRNWIVRARQHELDEDVLLMKAANQDLGAAD